MQDSSLLLNKLILPQNFVQRNNKVDNNLLKIQLELALRHGDFDTAFGDDELIPTLYLEQRSTRKWSTNGRGP